MPSLCAIFNCSIRGDKEKDKSNSRFSSIVKNNGKKGLRLLKVRREKWLAQISRRNLTAKESQNEQEQKSK